MTAFDRRAASYSFSLNYPNTSARTAFNIVSTTCVKINTQNIDDNHDDNCDDNRDDNRDNNLDHHCASAMKSPSNRNLTDRHDDVNVEIETEIVYDSETLSMKNEDKNNTKGKWHFPPPTSTKSSFSSYDTRDSQKGRAKDLSSVEADHINNCSNSHDNYFNCNNNNKNNNNNNKNNDNNSNYNADDNSNNNSDNDNENEYENMNEKDSKKKEQKNSLYSDLTIPISLFPVEGMFFSTMNHHGNDDGHDDNNYQNNSNNNISNNNNKKNSSNSSNRNNGDDNDTKFSSPLLPKITNNNQNNQRYGSNQSTIQVTSVSCRVKGSWEEPVKDSAGRLIDQPITFRSSLRSSGYGQQLVEKKVDSSGRRRSNSSARSAPSSTKTSTSTSDRANRSSSHTSDSDSKNNNSNNNSNNNNNSGKGRNESKNIIKDSPTVFSGPRLRLYPRDCLPMTLYQGHNDYPMKGSSSPSPIYDIAYR